MQNDFATANGIEKAVGGIWISLTQIGSYLIPKWREAKLGHIDIRQLMQAS